jgi:hypothetical protein
MMFTRHLLIAGAALFTACAPLFVHSYVERGANLTQYRTYDWGTPERLATGDARLDNNAIFDAATRRAVDNALAGKGFEPTTAGADLVVHYHISIKQQLDVGMADASYLPCDECTPTIYDVGTLVIDLVDARTNRLVWRGWGEGSFERLIDDQRALERRIEEVAAKILARLPVA